MKTTLILRFLLFLLLSLFFLVSSACKKYPSRVVELREYQKQWFFIDSGSYFIYTDSLNNLDSVFVKKISYPIISDRNGPEVRMYRCTFSNIYVLYTAGTLPQIHLERSNGSDYCPIVLQLNPPYPVTKRYSLNSFMSMSFLDTILPNVKCGNLMFDSTFVWHVSNDNILNSDSTTYYFSKGVGITRVIDHERKTDKWLIRYRIIKKAD